MPTDPNIFQKIGEKNIKNVKIAKIMLEITFLHFLDVLNFFICMFSGTVD